MSDRVPDSGVERGAPGESPRERFAAVLDLYAFAIEQMRANLRRRYPELDDATREQMLTDWLLDRPCAPEGDAVGRPRRLAR